MHLAKMHKLHSFGASKTKSPKTSQSKPCNIKTAPKSTTIVQKSNKIHPKLNPEDILGATLTPWANFDQLRSPKSSERLENLIPKSKQIRSKMDPEGMLKATSRRNWFLDRFGGKIDGFSYQNPAKSYARWKSAFTSVLTWHLIWKLMIQMVWGKPKSFKTLGGLFKKRLCTCYYLC